MINGTAQSLLGPWEDFGTRCYCREAEVVSPTGVPPCQRLLTRRAFAEFTQ